MEHAVRHHVRTRVDEDPVYYGKLSERIDEILDRLEERWDQIALELEGMIDEINAGRTDEDETGLDPTTELPFHSQMVEKVASSASETSERLISLTTQLVPRSAESSEWWASGTTPPSKMNFVRPSSGSSTKVTCSPSRASTSWLSNSSTSPKPTSTACHDRYGGYYVARSLRVGRW